MADPMPPRLAAWLAGWRVASDDREFAIGDLQEEFADRVARDGPARARRWYWRQTIRSCLTRCPRRFDHAPARPRRPLMQHLIHDVRFALRLLRRAPGFTAVVIVTLALGIGATTAIFSVVHAALLKPLPFKQPERLVTPLNGTGPTDASGLSYPQLLYWRDSSGAFEQLAGYFNWGATIGGTEEAELVFGLRSTASFFPVLGVEPIVGRLFTQAEEVRSAEPVVLISESLWRRRFNADPDMQGRRIALNEQPFTVIGVMPGWFRRVRPGDRVLDLFAPLRLTEQTAPASLFFMSTVARLKPGQTSAVAQEQLQAAVLRAEPATRPEPRVVVFPLRDRIVMNSRSVLLSLLGAVGFLLLITCANLANLLLARAVGRQREIAVRLAVGAGRGRVVTQLLTECVILSAVGGAAGMLVAWAAVRSVAGHSTLAEAGVYDLSLNWTVLGFAAGLSLAVGLLFGLMPALRARHASLAADLRDGTRVTGGGDRLRSAFVVAEVALTLMLLVGAGLLGRSLSRLIAVDKGFSADSVITFGLSTTQPRYPTNADQTRFFDTTIERLSRLPGVEAVGLSSQLPFSGGDTDGGVPIEGRTFPPGEQPRAQKRIVSPGYFAALGIPIKRGRTFATTDGASAPGVMVVSEAFAQRWFPNEDAIGKRVGFNWDMEGFQTVVGVVADVKHSGLDDPANPAIYVNYRQRADSAFEVAVRTTVPPESLMPAIRGEIKTVDPERPITNLQTMTAMVSASMGARRLSLDLVGAFAIIGLLLAATGIYGIVSHATQQRSREFGIRMALGAESTSVLRLVLGQGLVLALTGLVIGLGGALALGGVIRAHLFGVEPTDPVTLAAVSCSLLVVAVLACYLPARHAVRINPATVLRAD
jgi:putative ABC transport system permease protein